MLISVGKKTPTKQSKIIAKRVEIQENLNPQKRFLKVSDKVEPDKQWLIKGR